MLKTYKHIFSITDVCAELKLLKVFTRIDAI